MKLAGFERLVKALNAFHYIAMKIDQAKLNSIASDAIDRLSSIFPTKLGVVKEEARDKGMAFTIANPWAIGQPLQIFTGNGQLSVIFGSHRYTISDRGTERNEYELMEDMMLCIAFIINENSASHFKEDVTGGGGHTESNS